MDQLDNTENNISENNLFYKIWLKPTQTLEYILKYSGDKYLILLFILGGITQAIDKASSKNMGDHQSTIAVLLMAIVFGGLFGWISYYFYAWLLEVSGKWLKGRASFQEFKVILAWSSIPTICSLILLIPELMLLGDDLFKSESTQINNVSNVILIVFGILEITLGIWTVVIFIKGVSLIQNFKTGKAILNAIIPGLLIIIPILFLISIVKLFTF